MEETLIDKHCAFWKNEAGVVLLSQLDFSREPFRKRIYNENIKGPFTSDILDIDWLVQAYVNAFQGRPVINGDVFEFVQFAFVVPWMEGIIGCRLYSLGKGASMVAHPPDIDLAKLSQHLKDVLNDLDNNVWFNKLGDGIEMVVKALHGKYPVSQTLLRGPGDMLGALVGYEKLVTLMLGPSNKDYLHELLELCSSIWIETANMHHRRAGKFAGGYCDAFGIWAPGKTARSQEDFASLISPDMYTGFLVPHDIRIANAFEYSSIHMHSGYVASVYDWRSIAEKSTIKALQVSLDPMGPGIDELMKTLVEMNSRKPLIIRSMKSESSATLERRLSEFPGSVLLTSVDNESLKN
jgi:hypothetical protein